MIPFFMGRAHDIYEIPGRSKGTVAEHRHGKPLIDYFSRFYYDTAVGGTTAALRWSAAAVRCAYEVFGADQIVFGTDAGFGPVVGATRYAEYPNVIRSLGLSEADNKKIFEDNIRKILNLA